jgi:ribosomal protein S14
MTHKQKRRAWHDTNKPIVYAHFGGICQYCHLPIGANGPKWDVHHLTYNYHGRLYDTPADELIAAGVVTLICRPCHTQEHMADDPNNPQPLENRAYCERCGNSERGILERRKQMKLPQLLCRQCFRLDRAGLTQTSLF